MNEDFDSEQLYFNMEKKSNKKSLQQLFSCEKYELIECIIKKNYLSICLKGD